MRKITGKIVKVEVVDDTVQAIQDRPLEMHEGIKRPERLIGETYKLVTPVYDHSVYVTINDIILNEGTPYEQRRPFEIFINSKQMDSYPWIVALTRIMSAVFRKGGNIDFLIEELKSVFEPKGGYFKPGSQGKYMVSVVAEIGDILERHLVSIGMLKQDQIKGPEQKFVAVSDDGSVGTLCQKCFTKAVVRSEGCSVCMACGDSRCG